MSPLGRWKFDRSSWVAVLGNQHQAKDAHEGPLVDETSERHLGYQIRGNYQISVTGILFHWYTVGGWRLELINWHRLPGKDAFDSLAFCEGYAGAASDLVSGAYNRQLGSLLGVSSTVLNGSRICCPGRWTPQAAAEFPTLERNLESLHTDRRFPFPVRSTGIHRTAWFFVH